MSKFVCEVVRSEARASGIHRFFFSFIEIRPFSSSTVPVVAQDQHSFAANYLINTCGFDRKRAISASKHLRFKAPTNPDSVLAFLENHGLTKTQITSCIRRCPAVLMLNPDKNLLSKVEFLNSKGISRTDIARILSTGPSIFGRSLDNQIIPSFNFFTSFLGSEKKTIGLLNRYCSILVADLQHSVQNIEILRHAGVPNNNIMYLLSNQPRSLVASPTDCFRRTVEDVKKMGFNPAKISFTSAVHAFRAISKSTWKKKVEVYKKWGWSDNEIRLAFGKNPQCMKISEDKITRVMDFFVNKLGYKSSVIAERPGILCRSFKKRIVPRCAVYQVLVSKGLIKDQITRLNTLLHVPEKLFLDAVIEPYKREAPELLKLYEENLSLAK